MTHRFAVFGFLGALLGAALLILAPGDAIAATGALSAASVPAAPLAMLAAGGIARLMTGPGPRILLDRPNEGAAGDVLREFRTSSGEKNSDGSRGKARPPPARPAKRRARSKSRQA